MAEDGDRFETSWVEQINDLKFRMRQCEIACGLFPATKTVPTNDGAPAEITDNASLECKL